MPVFLAWQSQLRQNPGAWLPELRSRDLYLSLESYGGNSLSSLSAVERLIGTRFTMRRRHDGLRGVGRMFVLTEKSTASSARLP
jgi:hypothetical protein